MAVATASNFSPSQCVHPWARAMDAISSLEVAVGEEATLVRWHWRWQWRLARWWHRSICRCLAAVGGEWVGGIGGGVGDKSVAAAVLAVGLEGGNWHVRLRPYLYHCAKNSALGSTFICSREHFFAPGSALYCPPLTVVHLVSKIFQVWILYLHT